MMLSDVNVSITSIKLEKVLLTCTLDFCQSHYEASGQLQSVDITHSLFVFKSKIILYLNTTILMLFLFNQNQTVLCFIRFMIFSLTCLIARVLSWSPTQATTTECWSVMPGAIFIDNREIFYSSSCCRKWFATTNIIVSGFLYQSINHRQSATAQPTHVPCMYVLAGCWSLSLHSTISQGCSAEKMTSFSAKMPLPVMHPISLCYGSWGPAW